MNYAELSRRAEEYQMSKITLKTVIESLEHCSDKQEAEFLANLNNNTESWAGITLGEMIKEHVTSMEEGEESARAEEEGLRNIHLPARNLA